MEYKIKNCPFCGHPATLYQYQKQEHYIVCDNCGAASTICATEEEAILIWNTRFEPKTESITKLTINQNTLKYIDDEPWHNRIKYTNDKPWETM